MDDLKGKRIIAGRAYGMPEMTLKYAIKKNGIDPDKELELDTSVAFAAMSGTFIAGEGDFVSLFEHNVTKRMYFCTFLFHYFFYYFFYMSFFTCFKVICIFFF